MKKGENSHDNGILELGSNQLQLVDFRIYQTDRTGRRIENIYGANVAKVVEILKYPEKISIVPGGVPWQKGIMDLRGSVVPVIDLPRWVCDNSNVEGLQEDPACVKDSQILVTEFSSLRLGFVVHKAHRIRRVSWEEIVPLQTTTEGREATSKVLGTVYLHDDVNSQGDFLLLLDFEAIAESMGFFSRQEDIVANIPLPDTLPDKRLIVVADDSPTMLKTLQNLLTKSGYHVAAARNGKEALDILHKIGDKSTIGLVMSDVEMPVLDGYSLTKEIRKDPTLAAIPVLLHSSMSGQENVRKGLEAGANKYVVKLKVEELLAEIKQCLS